MLCLVGSLHTCLNETLAQSSLLPASWGPQPGRWRRRCVRRCAPRPILEERCQIPYLSQTLPTPRSCSGGIHQRWRVIQVLTTPWTFCDSDTGGHLWSVMPGPSSLSVPCVLAGSHPISLLRVSSTCYQSHPWSHMDVDFVTDLPPSDGHRVILTIVDQFSKAAHFVPLPKLPSAAETGDLLVRHVFHHHSILPPPQHSEGHCV